jgi:serine phosphatase RsbU (regulator of sigma subunit)
MVERMRIHPGGRLVLFTDGLTESRDLQGKEFGQIRSSKG